MSFFLVEIAEVGFPLPVLHGIQIINAEVMSGQVKLSLGSSNKVCFYRAISLRIAYQIKIDDDDEESLTICSNDQIKYFWYFKILIARNRNF